MHLTARSHSYMRASLATNHTTVILLVRARSFALLVCRAPVNRHFRRVAHGVSWRVAQFFLSAEMLEMLLVGLMVVVLFLLPPVLLAPVAVCVLALHPLRRAASHGGFVVGDFFAWCSSVQCRS